MLWLRAEEASGSVSNPSLTIGRLALKYLQHVYEVLAAPLRRTYIDRRATCVDPVPTMVFYDVNLDWRVRIVQCAHSVVMLRRSGHETNPIVGLVKLPQLLWCRDFSSVDGKS